MKNKPITFSIAIISLLLVALIWLSYSIITAAGLHTSYGSDSPLRWIMAGFALAASLELIIFSIFIWWGSRFAYILTLAFLLFIAILIITDQVGIIDLIIFVTTVIPIVLLLINRRWYYQSTKKRSRILMHKQTFQRTTTVNFIRSKIGYEKSIQPKLMIQFLVSKFLRVVGILVAATLVVFLLLHAVPGNPWANFTTNPRAMINISADPTFIRNMNQHYGLDLPLWRQFMRYLIGDIKEDGKFYCGAICGNLGPSISQRGRTVQDVIFSPPENQTFWQSRFGYSIRLVLFGSVIAVGLGIPIGFLSGTRPRSRESRIVSVFLAALMSVPNFVLGLLAIIVFAVGLKVIKVIPDWSNPGNWIIPAFVLAVIPLASIAKVTHASLENILSEDYVRTARGKGLSEARVMVVHVLRNALVPIITFLGPTVIEMFAGLMIVEVMFGFPGLGREYWQSVLKLDYGVILGLTLIYSLGLTTVSIVTEFLAEILDPRIRNIRQQGAP